MIYLDFVPAVADGCTVILLTHFDEMNLVNEAPYSISSVPTKYEIDTSLKAFGDGSLKAKTGVVVAQNSTIDYTGEPGGGILVNDGELTIEFWLRREGGVGDLIDADIWENIFYMDLDTGGFINISAYNNKYEVGVQRGFLIQLEGNSYGEVRIANSTFLPDSDFHAIAYTIDGAGNYAIYIDGTRTHTGSIGDVIPSGARITTLAFGGLLPLARQDETRVTTGKLHYTGATYTLAATEFLTTGCSDYGGTTTTVLLDFDDVTPAPNIELTSPYHGFTVSDVWAVDGVTGGSTPNCIYQAIEASPANPVFEAADPISTISFGSLLVSGTLAVEGRTVGGTLIRSDSVNTADSVWRDTSLTYAVGDAVKKLVFVGAVDSWLVDDLSITTVT